MMPCCFLNGARNAPTSCQRVLKIWTGGAKVRTNLNGLLSALQQSINEAILQSHDVAAALAALKRTGRSPAFTIEVALEESQEPSVEPAARPATRSALADELVLSDEDVEFLAILGISDPSWSRSRAESTSKAGTP